MDQKSQLLLLTGLVLIGFLALVPMSLWTGYLIGKLSGWRWSVVPFLISSTFAFAAVWSACTGVLLMNQYGWQKDFTEYITNLSFFIVVFCFACGGHARYKEIGTQ